MSGWALGVGVCDVHLLPSARDAQRVGDVKALSFIYPFSSVPGSVKGAGQGGRG